MSGTFNLQNLNINGIATITGSGSIIATSCTGNSATATTATTATSAGTCTGNSVTATTATSAGTCTGNSATATTATTATRITATSGTPVSKTATGTTGTINYDASFVYICVSTNNWIRIAIDTTF